MSYQGNDRRKTPRYDVSDYLNMKATLRPSDVPLHLLTLSEGGCGFWTPEIESVSKIPKVVSCSFFWEGLQMITAEGESIYRYPHQFKSMLGIFIGVKFFNSEIIKLKPLLAEIEARPDLKSKQAAYR